MGAVPAAMIPDKEAARWPYQSHLELGAISSAVPSARLHARLVLREWGLSADKAEAAELVVSELVTNALEHGLAGIPATVRIWLSSDGGSVVINVWDASRTQERRCRRGQRPRLDDRGGAERRLGLLRRGPRQGCLGRHRCKRGRLTAGYHDETPRLGMVTAMNGVRG
jgi:anti-sigma regulatory factor (Ser/Thr protein kinase)